MKTKQLTEFKKLSELLTGFSSSGLVSTGLLKTYYWTTEKELGSELFDSLLENFSKLNINDPLQLTIRELSSVRDFLDHTIFKSYFPHITKLWYLGQWTDDDSGNNKIISSNSYLEGLVWKAIKAHPMGGKQPGFATWSFPPSSF